MIFGLMREFQCYVSQILSQDSQIVAVYLKNVLHIVFSILNSKHTKPCALAFYFLVVILIFGILFTTVQPNCLNGRSEHESLLTRKYCKIVWRPTNTEQSLTKLTLCQNLKQIEQIPIVEKRGFKIFAPFAFLTKFIFS